jgi:hypothetical protein
MTGKKKLGEIKAEVAALLGQLPGRAPREWLGREIESAKRDRNRDVEALEMLCAVLEEEAAKGRKPNTRRRPAKR